MSRFLVLLLSFFFIMTSVCHSKMMSIRGDKVNLRSGPGVNFSVKWEYGSGFPLKIISQKGDWYKVQDFENDTGWISKSLLTPTPHMIVKVNKNKDKKINIRSGPGKKYKVLGKAYYGVVFETLQQQNGWAKIKHETGLEGWTKRTLLWGF